MANILTQEDDKNKEMQTSAPLQQNDGVQSTGGGPTATANPATQAVQNKPQGSGRFTNLQKYLGANQKASEQLTGGIRQKGEGYMDKVRQGIQSAQGVQQGIQDERSRIGQAGTLAQGIQDDAVNVAQNNLQDVTQLRLGQNQANQLQGRGQQTIQDLSQNINPLQRFGQNLGTESGRFQVLQDTYGGAFKPNYNMGQRRLDQLFLQAGDDQGLNQLGSDIGQTVGSANQNLSSLQKDLGTGIQGIRSGAQQAQRDILNAIGVFNPDQQGAFGTLYGDFGTEQQARRDELQRNVDRARAQFGTGTLSQSVADMLGFTGSENVSDLDLIDYAGRNINLGDTDVTMADVAHRADLQDRLNALAQLSGTQTSDYDLGEKAGQDILFDAGKFARDAAEQRNTYEDRFFDKDTYGDILTADYFDRIGYDNTADALRQGDDRYEGISVMDEILSRSNEAPYTGGKFSARAQYNMLDDEARRTRDMLEVAAAGAQAAEDRGWIGADARPFHEILRMFDTQRNRNFGIGQQADDLEGGGFFNVT